MVDRDGRLAGIRVGVLEDTGIMREIYLEYLVKAGAEVPHVASRAAEFLAGLAAAAPDVVIIDIRLGEPDEDSGLDAALRIRDQFPSMAVLVITQIDDHALAMRLLASGSKRGVGYLVKDRLHDVDTVVNAVRVPWSTRCGSSTTAA